MINDFVNFQTRLFYQAAELKPNSNLLDKENYVPDNNADDLTGRRARSDNKEVDLTGKRNDLTGPKLLS